MKKTFCFFFALAAIGLAQSTYPNAIDTDCTLLVANDLAQATLSADIDADDTTLTLSTASSFGNCMVFKIDNEQIKCNIWTSGSRTYTSCTRGFGDTTPASHSATGADCTTSPYPGCARGIITKAHHTYLKNAIINMQTALGASLYNVYNPTASINFADTASSKPFKTGTTLPSSCLLGEAFFKTDATAGQNIYLCTDTDEWTPVISTVESSATTGIYVADFSSQDPLTISNATHGLQACPASVTIAVDDGTNYTHSESWNNWSCVKSTYQVTIDFPVATSGRVWLVRGSGAAAGGSDCMLQVNVNGTLGGISGTCASGSTVTVTGLINLLNGTLRIPSGATKPATCTVGDVFADSDETPAGQQVHYCSATNTWSKIGDGGSGGGGGTINVTAGFGLEISTVDGVNQINLQPSIAALQGGDNEYTGTNHFGMGGEGGYLSKRATNDTSTGTETYKLVSLASTGLIRSSTAANGLSVGVCLENCGISGDAEYVRSGEVLCAYDNASTKGNYVVRSTTAAGQCHDSGVASSSGARPAGFVVGVCGETGGSSGNKLLDIIGSDIR